MRHIHLVELFEKRFRLLGSDRLQTGDFTRYELDLFFRELLNKFGADLISQQNQEHGGFAHTCYGVSAFRCGVGDHAGFLGS